MRNQHVIVNVVRQSPLFVLARGLLRRFAMTVFDLIDFSLPKLHYMKRPVLTIPFIICLILVQIIAVNPSFGQSTTQNNRVETYTLIFKGESLKLALQKLVKKTDMSLIYDPAVMIDFQVFKVAKNKTPEQILRLILKGSGLDFIQLSSGTYVLINAPQKRVQRGNLVGRVVSRNTGGPLAGANIAFVGASGGAVTNQAGYFSMPDLQQGPYKITITYVGYKPVKDTVWVPANQTIRHRFAMMARPVLLKPVVVKSMQKRLPAAMAFTGNVLQNKIQKGQVTGSADAIKSLNTVSGLSFGLPLANFNIQGGKASGHQLLLDGVPIYNPFSMGRLLSAFSPFAINKITVKKSGFGSPAGSHLSGVVNLHQAVSVAPDNALLVEANPLNVNIRADQAFDFGDEGSVHFMAAGRSNIWKWYKKPALKQTLQNWDRIDPLINNYLASLDSTYTYFKPQRHGYDITYYDLHFATRIEHNPFHQTYISAYRGKSILETSLFSKNVILASSAADLYYSIDHYNWTNTMAKIDHSWLINSHFDITMGAYITHHSLNHNYVITDNVQEGFSSSAPVEYVGDALEQRAVQRLEMGDKNAITESSLQFNLNYNASKNYHLKTGLSFKHLDYQFRLFNQYYQASHSNANSLLLAGFVQNNFFLSRKASVSVGSRITFIPSRDLFFAEPRFSVQYDEPETAIGYLSAKLSGGIYRQFINQFEVTSIGPSSLVPSLRFWVPVDYTTTVPKAYHIAGHFLWQPDKSWQVRFEMYYKWIPARLVLDYSNLSDLSFQNLSNLVPNTKQQQFITQAHARAYGLTLSAEKSIPALGLQLDAQYEYNISQQRIPLRFGGDYQPAPWSQPHTLSTSLNWHIKPELAFTLQWRGIWGRSWGFRKAYYDYLSSQTPQQFGTYHFNNPANDRLPLYAQLNTGVSYQLTLGESNLRFRLSFYNLLDHQNVLNWWLLPYKSGAGTISYDKRTRSMPGLSTSFSIKFTY